MVTNNNSCIKHRAPPSLTLSQVPRKTIQAAYLVTRNRHTEWEISAQVWEVAIVPSKLAWGLDAWLLVSDSQGWVTMPPLIETFLYLRFHLCSLFWVNCQDVLVMADGVQAVLVLGTNIALQSLQDAVGLQDLRRGRVHVHLIQIKFTAEIQHFGCEPALLPDRSITCANFFGIFLTIKSVRLGTLCLMNTKQSGGVFNQAERRASPLGDSLLGLQHKLPATGNLFPASAPASHWQSPHQAILTFQPARRYPVVKVCCKETHPRRVSLQGSQVVLQSNPTAIIQHGFHTSQVSFHKLLLLTCCLFLQGFNHCLEVLQQSKESVWNALYASGSPTASHVTPQNKRSPVTLPVLGIYSTREGHRQMLMQISSLQIQ